MSCEQNPNIIYKSYEAMQEETGRGAPEIEDKSDTRPMPLLRPDQGDVSQATDSAEIWTKKLDDEWIVSPDKEALEKIVSGFEDTLICRPPVYIYIILGLGPPTAPLNRERTMRQYYLAYHIIKRHMGRLANCYKRFFERLRPQIYIDSTNFTFEDQLFCTVFFKNQDTCVMKMAPFGRLATIACFPQAFLILLKPLSPVRQIMADIFERSLTWPQAVICAPYDYNGDPEDGWHGDRTSKRVKNWLQPYTSQPFITDVPEFGPISFHILNKSGTGPGCPSTRSIQSEGSKDTQDTQEPIPPKYVCTNLKGDDPVALETVLSEVPTNSPRHGPSAQ